MSGVSRREAGYALSEVLVAAAIAAGVLIATMTGLSSSLRAARAADAARIEQLTAANIAARLRAGLPAGLAVEGYQGWRVAMSATDEPVDPRTGAALSVARILPPDGSRPAYTLIVLHEGAGS